MFLRLLTFISFILSSSLFAIDKVPVFYWDNQDKFVEAKNCTIVPVERNYFRFSQYSGSGNQDTENLRNHAGVRQSHLVNHSLVKVLNGKYKKSYEYMEVVGVNQMEGITTNQWYSERGDRGYLFHRSLLPAEDFILFLKKGTPDVPMGEVRDSALGTMWHIAAEDNYFKLKCPENDPKRDYLVFKVYNVEKKDAPMALVGVYWDETEIFRSFESLSKARAYRVIPTILDEVETNLLLSEDEYQAHIEQLAEENEEEETPEIITINDGATTLPEVIQGGMENVICTSSGALNVRDESLTKVLFTALLGEKVKIFQDWESQNKKATINGIEYRFIKVQIDGREEGDQIDGWVAERFIQPRSTCKHINNHYIRDPNVKITGLDDPKCCEFPLEARPTHSYQQGMRRFKAGRSKGRRHHAACDLYRYKDEPVLSVAPGKVIRAPYFFYQGTYALEVLHDSGFIVRYGEITGKTPSGIKKDARVKMGDRVGYVGKVNSNCCRPMLHFELYSGEKTGALTQGGNSFRRRSDLLDPTKHLIKWENKKF